MPLIYVLRFPLGATMQLLSPIGGNTVEGAQTIGGQFVDHPPFTGNGFAGVGTDLVPVWWLDPTRLPPGAELWRVQADGSEHLTAVYRNVADGWVMAEGNSVDESAPLPPSDVAGTFATWRGTRCLADPLPDGTVVVASFTDIPGAGLRQGPRGLWSTTVPASEVTALHLLRMTCTWHGQSFQLLRRWHDGQQLQARLFYLGRNAYAAEATGLDKTDAGCYEATAPIDELTDVQAIQLTAG